MQSARFISNWRLSFYWISSFIAFILTAGFIAACRPSSESDPTATTVHASTAVLPGIPLSTASVPPASSTTASGDFSIQLQVGRFDPLIALLPLPADLMVDAYPPGESYYLIQFSGPILQEWQDLVDAAGAVRIGYVPNYAYLVRVNSPEQIETIRALPAIRWMGLYQPGYKLSPDLKNLSGSPVKVTILSFPGADNQEIQDRLIEWGGVIEQSGQNPGGGSFLVAIPPEQFPGIARLPGVMWIEPWIAPGLSYSVRFH